MGDGGADGRYTVLHLVDTPGHVDFRAEVLSSYRSTDSALLLVDASQGIQGRFIFVTTLKKHR
jgi:translation elongation factor EF-4